MPESVSLTDCVVMALADSYESHLVFGYDSVFSKHGYRLPDLLKVA